ncbi:MAG: tetratricopeptide repeat protein [Anaerolineae bacterium]|nr:tetratricopeptide repeat protein [Anaerolineae bacterium]
MSQLPSSPVPPESAGVRRVYAAVVFGAVLLLIVFAMAFVGLRLWSLAESEGIPPGDATPSEQADQAVTAAAQILDFLQGTSILVGLALGAAAIYGFRNAQQTRQELKDEVAAFEKMQLQLKTELAALQQEIARKLETLDAFRDELDALPQKLADLGVIREEIEAAIHDIRPIFSDLLQASQELRLKNYSEAYTAAQRVLARDPENPQALYIAGWLELHHISGQLDAGIDKLRHALRINPQWPAALAAYGVGLRRRAFHETGAARQNLLIEAEGALKQALGQNPNLIDLNMESFWGTVGGILRDTGQVDGAIAAYEQARRTTPGSSYPVGNLAALYLQKAKTDPQMRVKALQAFEDALDSAQKELSFSPNDYFNMMDIAMSTMMMGQADKIYFDSAHDALEAALLMGEVTPEVLGVSLRGWQHLRNHCPDEWADTIQHLDKAIARVQLAIAVQTGQGG